jgi:uncharacterized membrane protein
MTLVALIAIVFSIIAISKSNEALSKVTELKNQLRRMEGDKVKKETHVTEPLMTPVEQAMLLAKEHDHQKNTANLTAHTANTPSHTSHPLPRAPQEDSAFVKWLKEDWLLKLGGVLVLMGVLFFLSLAFTIIGPQGKVAVGYLFGVSFMVFGFKYIKKQLIPGSAVHLIGAVIVIITTYVARLPDYNLFNSYIAMLLMFLTSACIALTAYAYNRSELAHVGLMISALVPMLVSTGTPTFFEILMYLLVVILGVLWLALITKWRSLVFLALMVVFGYSLLAASGAYGASGISSSELYLVALFGILFYITSLFSIFRGAGVMEKYDALVALLNAAFAIFWVVKEASPEAAPLIIAFLSLAYATGFFLIYKLTSVYTSFIVYGGVSLGMLTTAVMLELSGRPLTITLLLMGAGATIFTYYLSKNEEVTKIIAFFNVLPLLYVFQSIGNIARLSYPMSWVFDAWKDFLILGLAISIYVALYRYFVNRVKSLGYIALFAAILLGMDVIWQVLHLMTTEGFATELSFLIIGVWLTIFTYNFSTNRENTEKVAFINIISFIGVGTSVSRIQTSILYPTQIQDIWKDWSSVFLVMAVAFALYFFFVSRIKTVGYAGLTAGLFLVVTSIWQLLHLTIGGGMATFVSILIYTIVGLYNLWSGSMQNNETKIKISRVWLGFVAARVIFFDAWQTGNVAVGVLICIVIGVLLLSSAFIIKKATTTTAN